VVNLGGVGNRAWTSPELASQSDDNWATAAPLVTDDASNYLYATGFGFNVPPNAVVLGITAFVERSSLLGLGIMDHHVQLVSGGAVEPTDRFHGGLWGASDLVVAYGGSSDRWGHGWTAAEVNVPGFGLAFAARFAETAGNDWARVDQIRLQVDYGCVIAPPPACTSGSTGPVGPFSVVTLPGAGVAWQAADDARIADDLRAQAPALAPNRPASNYLYASGFEFNLPASALVRGITVFVERSSLAGYGIVDQHVQLVRGGALQPVDRPRSDRWTATDLLVAYGGADDLWGQGWTAADLNAPGFGLAFAARFADIAGNDWPQVDEIRIQVDYTCP
jgi:hypothetical protein